VIALLNRRLRVAQRVRNSEQSSRLSLCCRQSSSDDESELATRQLSESFRPSNDSFEELVTGRFWPIARIQHDARNRPLVFGDVRQRQQCGRMLVLAHSARSGNSVLPNSCHLNGGCALKPAGCAISAPRPKRTVVTIPDMSAMKPIVDVVRVNTTVIPTTTEIPGLSKGLTRILPSEYLHQCGYALQDFTPQ
jgi:hypothetical protein